MTLAPTARCRELVLAGRRAEAEAVVAELVARQFDMVVRRASINADWTSLNSVNGAVEADDGRRYFFKFHQEEGEEATVREYYRGEVLQRAGLPVDMPVEVSREPGSQILLYAFRRERPLADICLDLERAGDDARARKIVALQEDLDRRVGRVYVETLHAADAAQAAAEPVHQLFHHRLWTPPDNERLAGRVARFYAHAAVRLPRIELSWHEFSDLRWQVNGVGYRHTLGELFAESLARLDPARLGVAAVTGHGDAHNANVWVEDRDRDSRLVLFDPAFAGEHLPALLADVKATFHNIFAHPLWLYHPAQAEPRFHVEVALDQGRLIVEHDWALTPLREAFLRAKVDLVWRPLLAALRARGWLPDAWQRIVRCALFCCPTLVMNLRAGVGQGVAAGRSPALSALSFALAVMAGSEPDGGASDPFRRFVAAISPAAEDRGIRGR
ncbi:MAG: hypothetical protein IT518_04130 [Burkholderiales bacterium]|nr:hypothetical protein [Burkholderiales bacterium]